MTKGAKKHVAENSGINRGAKNPAGLPLLYDIVDQSVEGAERFEGSGRVKPVVSMKSQKEHFQELSVAQKA